MIEPVYRRAGLFCVKRRKKREERQHEPNIGWNQPIAVFWADAVFHMKMGLVSSSKLSSQHSGL